jgi:hypothetical protein
MEKVIKIRQFYFAGLFSSILYFSLLLIFIGKAKNPEIRDLYIYFITFSSFLILYFFYLRIKNKIFNLKNYVFSLILGHVPLILGFIFTLLEKNYIYILISFPLFFINYLILIPWSKDGLQNSD